MGVTLMSIAVSDFQEIHRWSDSMMTTVLTRVWKSTWILFVPIPRTMKAFTTSLPEQPHRKGTFPFPHVEAVIVMKLLYCGVDEHLLGGGSRCEYVPFNDHNTDCWTSSWCIFTKFLMLNFCILKKTTRDSRSDSN